MTDRINVKNTQKECSTNNLNDSIILPMTAAVVTNSHKLTIDVYNWECECNRSSDSLNKAAMVIIEQRNSTTTKLIASYIFLQLPLSTHFRIVGK